MKESFVSVAGARTQVLSAGRGEPLLYLHGAGSAGQWPPFLESLSSHFHVFAPTHPGFGQSERPEWIDRVDDVAFFYLDLLDELKLDRVHLIGHSIGGWIAAALAASANGRIRKLVLFDPAGLKPAGVHLPDLFSMSDAESARATIYDPALVAARINAKVSVEELERQLSDKAALARLAWNPYLHDPKLSFRLHRASMPALVVWGRQDGLLPIELAPYWLEALPNARLLPIDRAGHSPFKEQPDEVSRAVLDFLTTEHGA